MSERAFSALENKTITKVEVDQDNYDDQIDFYTECGKHYRMKHYQDCCEHVHIEDINGDLDDLVGSEIVRAVEAVGEYNRNYGHQTWTFYHIRTQDRVITIRWVGESSGYYSESVCFEEIAQ